jgi:hypothetical protein
MRPSPSATEGTIDKWAAPLREKSRIYQELGIATSGRNPDAGNHPPASLLVPRELDFSSRLRFYHHAAITIAIVRSSDIFKTMLCPDFPQQAQFGLRLQPIVRVEHELVRHASHQRLAAVMWK